MNLLPLAMPYILAVQEVDVHGKDIEPFYRTSFSSLQRSPGVSSDVVTLSPTQEIDC